MRRIAVLAIALVGSGCATMVAPKTEAYRVISEPPGAPVLVNGKQVGATPYSLQVEHQRPLPVVLVGDPNGIHGDCRLGFHPGVVYVGVDVGLCVFTILGCITLVDWSSGAWNQLDHGECKVDLAYQQRQADLAAEAHEKEQAKQNELFAQERARAQATDTACLAANDKYTFDLVAWCGQQLQAHGNPEGSLRMWILALRKARSRDETCAAVNVLALASLHPEQDMAGTSPMVIQGCQAQKACLKRCADTLNDCLNTPVQAHILSEHTTGCYDNDRVCRAGCQ